VDYLAYALVILIFSAVSVAHEIYLARKAARDLQKLIPEPGPVHVIRDGSVTSLEARELVVGDLVVVETTDNLPCDLVLIQGECVVDESSLTGETVPVVKTLLPSTQQVPFSIDRHKAHVLFAGSKVIQVKKPSSGSQSDASTTTRDGVLGLVVSTGFSTSKGELFRTLLFPKNLVCLFLISIHVLSDGM
jgi:P-type E1-E2 ATPase